MCKLGCPDFARYRPSLLSVDKDTANRLFCNVFLLILYVISLQTFVICEEKVLMFVGYRISCLTVFLYMIPDVETCES